MSDTTTNDELIGKKEAVADVYQTVILKCGCVFRQEGFRVEPTLYHCKSLSDTAAIVAENTCLRSQLASQDALERRRILYAKLGRCGDCMIGTIDHDGKSEIIYRSETDFDKKRFTAFNYCPVCGVTAHPSVQPATNAVDVRAAAEHIECNLINLADMLSLQAVSEIESIISKHVISCGCAAKVEALRDCQRALKSLDDDALGRHPEIGYPYRDELLAKVDAALKEGKGGTDAK